MTNPEIKSLERLKYTSKATQAFGTQALFDLLNQARKRNHELGLTGKLTFANGSFTQTIEGPCDALDVIWTSICQDTRHTDVQLLERAPISNRQYESWAMAFSSYRYLNSYKIPGYAPIESMDL